MIRTTVDGLRGQIGETVTIAGWVQALRLQRAMQQRDRLRKIDDVDVVAGAEDVVRHLRVPAVGLMAEVHASFEKLAHRIVRKRH